MSNTKEFYINEIVSLLTKCNKESVFCYVLAFLQKMAATKEERGCNA